MPVYPRLLNMEIGPSEAITDLSRLFADDRMGSVLFWPRAPAAVALVAILEAALVAGITAMLALLLAVIMDNLEPKLPVILGVG